MSNPGSTDIRADSTNAVDFHARLKGKFYGMLQWADLDALWARVFLPDRRDAAGQAAERRRAGRADASGGSVGEALTELKATMTKESVPAGYQLSYGGQA